MFKYILKKFKDCDETEVTERQTLFKNRLKQISTIISVSISKNMVYRFSFFLNALLLILVTSIHYLFWKASFQGHEVIDAYNFTQLFSYIVSVNLIYRLTNPDDVMFSDEIREGLINTQLIKPYSILSFHFLKLIGNKCAFFISTLLPFAIVVALLAQGNLIKFHVNFVEILLVLGFIFLGLTIHYHIETVIGLLAFWYERSDFLLIFKEIIFWLLAGLWIPYNLMPDTIEIIFQYLPFRFIAYVPAQILAFGQISLLREVFVGLGWMVVLHLLSHWTLKRGLKKYEGYGG